MATKSGLRREPHLVNNKKQRMSSHYFVKLDQPVLIMPILFSLVSYAIQASEHVTPDAQPYSFTNLPPPVVDIMSALQSRVEEVFACVRSLTQLLKRKPDVNDVYGSEASEGEEG